MGLHNGPPSVGRIPTIGAHCFGRDGLGQKALELEPYSQCPDGIWADVPYKLNHCR